MSCCFYSPVIKSYLPYVWLLINQSIDRSMGAMQTLSYSLWQEIVGQTGWMKKEKGRKWKRGPEMEWYRERKTCFLMSNATTAYKQNKVNEMRLTEERFSVLFAQVVIARYCVECYWQGLAISTEHLFCCIMHLKHSLLACLYNCVYA